MNFILGAALIVAAMTLIHAGRPAVERALAVSAKREALIGDFFAIGFTALFSTGVMVLLRELLSGTDPLRLTALAASVAAAVVASKLIAAAFRRAAARSLPGALPQ